MSSVRVLYQDNKRDVLTITLVRQDLMPVAMNGVLPDELGHQAPSGIKTSADASYIIRLIPVAE